MTRKIKITSDSTCDLNEELIKKHNIDLTPLHIVYDGQSFDDSVNITPADVIARFRNEKKLPKTAAVSVWEYTEMFKKYVDEGYEVIHINIGSAISSSHQNAVAAANDVGHVYVIDSQSLSCGTGLLVLKAAKYVEKTTLTAEQIAKEISELVKHISMSFVLDDLEFLRAGGRCSTLAMLGANLLNIKPCIECDCNNGSTMTVGRKYRGKFDKVISQYVREKLSQFSDFDPDNIIVVSCEASPEVVENMCEIVGSLGVFKNVFRSTASCTITSHCGPNVVGIGFLTR